MVHCLCICLKYSVHFGNLIYVFHFQMYNYGRIKHWPPWIDNLTRLNHVLLALNSSINIVIYTAKVSLIVN